MGATLAAAGVLTTAAALNHGTTPPPPNEQAARYLEENAVLKFAEDTRPTLAVVGDSFAPDKTDAWPAKTAFCTGHRLALSGMGGSGFWNPGQGDEGGKVYKHPERVEAVTKDDPAIIILESAYNDSFRAEKMADTLEQHIVDTVEVYKAAAPGAKIVLVGPIWAIEPPTVGIKNNHAALASAAEQTGVDYINGIGWLPTKEYTSDDLRHANTKGNQQITAAILGSLKAKGLIESTGGCDLLTP